MPFRPSFLLSRREIAFSGRVPLQCCSLLAALLVAGAARAELPATTPVVATVDTPAQVVFEVVLAEIAPRLLDGPVPVVIGETDGLIVIVVRFRLWATNLRAEIVQRGRQAGLPGMPDRHAAEQARATCSGIQTGRNRFSTVSFVSSKYTT